MGTPLVPELIDVGFFRELEFNPDSEESRELGSIHERLSDFPQEHEAEIVGYLRGGACLGAAACYVSDALDPSSRVALTPHLYTDGTYCWRLDIAHYVEKYHLRLPADFIRHMAGRNWRPPPENEINLSELE
jgi:hypothetical protein